MKSDQVFVYVGDGEGVPGLPHQVTVSEAEAGGVLKLLEAAIQNGNYAPVGLDTAAPTRPTKPMKKDESEVDDGR